MGVSSVSRIAAVRRPSSPWWAVAATLLAVLPLVCGFVMLVGTWVPPLDDAYIALRTGDVFSSHPVLTGQRSTSYVDGAGVQAHHPGPLENYLLAIPYALSGFHAWGILLGDLLVIAVSLWVAISVCARVWRPVWALLPVATVWIMTLVAGPRLMLRPWNPTFALVPLVALIVVAAALWRGGDRALRWMPAYVVLASLVTQAHLAYAPVVGLLSVVLACLGVHRWRAAHGEWWPRGAWSASARGPAEETDGAPRRYRPGLWAFVAGVVVWTPPVIEQIVYSPGNFVAMWEYFTAGASAPDASAGSGGVAHPSHIGALGGFAVLSNLVVPTGSFVSSSLHETGSIPASPFGVIVLLAVVVLAGRYLWAVRSGRTLRCAQQLIVVSAVLLLGCWAVVSVMSASRSLIYTSTYVPITVMALMALLADGVDALAWRFGWHAPRLGRVGRTAVVALVVLASLGLGGLNGVELTSRDANRAERQMIDGVADGLKAHHIGGRAVRIDPGTDVEYLRERDTLAWGLDRHGIGLDMTFPEWNHPSDDGFRIHPQAQPGSVRLMFVHAPTGQTLPAAPDGAVLLWRGTLPSYGPIPTSTLAVYTPSLR